MRKLIGIAILSIVTISCSRLPLDHQDAEGISPSLDSLSTPYRPPQEGNMDGPQTPTCTHYVAPDGSDEAPGSADLPWGSFQHAADIASPGQIICFRGGTYQLEEAVHIHQPGTRHEPIWFVAAPSEAPVLDGGGGVGNLVILEPQAAHLTISGFTLQNFNIWGIDLSAGTQHITLDHLTIEGGEAGIHFSSGEMEQTASADSPVEQITLADSVIANSVYTAVDCTPGPCNHMVFQRLEVYGAGVGDSDSFGADGIAISRGYPILVEDCFIHDNAGDGIDLNSRDHAGHADGVLVRQNYVVRNHQNGIKLWAGGRIANNAVWGQGNTALWLGTFDSELDVVNNTVVYNMWDPRFSGRNWAVAVGYPEIQGQTPEVKLTLANNLFAFNTGPGVGEPTGIYLGPGVEFMGGNNLYYSREDAEIEAVFLDAEFTRQEIANGGWEARSDAGQPLTLDPLLQAGWPEVSVGLRSGSPGIDAGDETHCPEIDIHGSPRPADGDGDGHPGCDVGAVEAPEP